VVDRTGVDRQGFERVLNELKGQRLGGLFDLIDSDRNGVLDLSELLEVPLPLHSRCYGTTTMTIVGSASATEVRMHGSWSASRRGCHMTRSVTGGLHRAA
jgi:hypothetical protein